MGHVIIAELDTPRYNILSEIQRFYLLSSNRRFIFSIFSVDLNSDEQDTNEMCNIRFQL